MGKEKMCRMLCAYENKMPGSAAEKLDQRADLEAMLNQLETESFQRATEELPETRRELERMVARARSEPGGLDGQPEGAVICSRVDLLEAEDELAAARRTEEQLGYTDTSMEHTTGNESGLPSAKEMLDATKRLRCVRRCVTQGGEIPVHFITLTTAIYHWDDLGRLLREYEARTTAHRGGRCDPLEPGEDKVPEDKRRVLQHIGAVAWFCAVKLGLAVHYVLTSDAYFGVFEWGSGGIVHMHLLRWLGRRGRYDRLEGSVPAEAQTP